MKLKIICKYGRYPAADGGTSCFWLSGGGANVVMDMGGGALIGLEQNGLPLPDTDAIALSHLHFDHMSDVLALVYKCEIYEREGRLKNKIPLYLPDTPSDVFALLERTGAFDLRVVKDGDEAFFKSLKLTFFAMKHPVETYAVRCEADGKALAYTADTVYNENIARLIEGCSSVFADACVLARDFNEKSPHISVRDIARLTRESRSKIVLIHLPPEGDLDGILEEALSENENAALGETGVWYEV
ncbi:MAG: MBL fold metallo-hydrolase [Clostridiales bacterium]|jgi:ribonuclease BN (tRNA processing enzyme)|nr:MBL fold metallo-hydrolase [Clostridiales bacterium]